MIQKCFEKALEKGNIGEQIFRERLEKKGWSVFIPVTEGAHHFDMMATKNKEIAIAFDIKAKARMNKYNATGVNQKHFEEYKQFSTRHNMDFWIVFVDELLGTVYGNTLKELEKPYFDKKDKKNYPFIMKTSKADIRIWSLESMKHIAHLSETQKEQLKDKNQRSYEYDIRR